MKILDLKALRKIILEIIDPDPVNFSKKEENLTRKFLDRYYALETFGMVYDDAIEKIKMELSAIGDIDTNKIIDKVKDSISGEKQDELDEFERPPINESDLRAIIRNALEKRLYPS